MNVVEAILSRRTIRAFRPDPVDKDTVMRILEAANQAPSWANTQPWEVFVATGEVLERLRAGYLARLEQGVAPRFDLEPVQHWPAAHQKRIEALQGTRLKLLGLDPEAPETRQAIARYNYSFFGAPVVVYLCMDRSLNPWSLFDLGSFAQSLMLAAREYGLDSAPAVNLVAYPDLIRAELGIPEELAVVIGVALGRADADALINRFRSTRRPLAEVVRLFGW
ncbi:MAG: nitroreductase [Clostridia bacterium]|nr:nitroreductase [Clostridia bacterium]MDH7573142.1 nitroreductase [Clostridia bacterium]